MHSSGGAPQLATRPRRGLHARLTPRFHTDLGNRLVEIRSYGKGNSAGDAVLYLPRERVLITGDLVASPGRSRS